MATSASRAGRCPPGAGCRFVVDLKTELIGVREAQRLRIPLIGLVDTNCDPDGVDFVIPGNDDAIRSCDVITRALGNSIAEGAGQWRAAEEARIQREQEAAAARKAEDDARREAEEAARRQAAAEAKAAEEAAQAQAAQAAPAEAAAPPRPPGTGRQAATPGATPPEAAPEAPAAPAGPAPPAS